MAQVKFSVFICVVETDILREKKDVRNISLKTSKLLKKFSCIESSVLFKLIFF